jgi:hypothetical protein
LVDGKNGRGYGDRKRGLKQLPAGFQSVGNTGVNYSF